MSSKPSDPSQDSISVQIANDIINMANEKLEKGVTPAEIAAGMRHAAANFTAFAFFQSTEPTKDPNVPVEEFISLFERYLSVHKPKEDPMNGLMHLVEQAKNEVVN